MLEVVLWVLFGALAGWIAALLVRTNSSVQILLPTVTGATGAVIGGILFKIYGHPAGDSLVLSIVTATFGAILLLAVIEFIRQK